MAIHSAPPRLYGLDLLRALAIIFVFFFHYGYIFPHPAWVHDVSRFGWTGVDLFFVLSGFLIASQLFRNIARGEQVPFRDFFVKRFFRIIPPYGLVVAIYFLFPLIREREGIAPFWKFATFTQNLGLDLRYQAAFSHAWSLCIEEQFYLLLPVTLALLIYLKLIRNGWIALLALFLAGFAIRLFAWYHFALPYADQDDFNIYWHKWIYYPTFGRLDGLLSGVGVAAIVQFRPRWQQHIARYANALLFLGVIMLAAAYFLCIPEDSFSASVFGFPLVDTAYGVMVLAVVAPRSILYNVKSSAISTIATYSYTIYLTHKLVIHAVQNGFEKAGYSKESNAAFAACMVACLLCGFLMNRLIENPSLAIRKKIVAKQ